MCENIAQNRFYIKFIKERLLKTPKDLHNPEEIKNLISDFIFIKTKLLYKRATPKDRLTASFSVNHSATFCTYVSMYFLKTYFNSVVKRHSLCTEALTEEHKKIVSKKNTVYVLNKND